MDGVDHAASCSKLSQGFLCHLNGGCLMKKRNEKQGNKTRRERKEVMVTRLRLFLRAPPPPIVIAFLGILLQ